MRRLEADARLAVAARIVGSGAAGMIQVDFINTSPDAIELWEFCLMLTNDKCLVIGIAMEQVVLPGGTYTWDAPLDGMRRSFAVDGADGFDGVMVSAYSLSEIDDFPHDLYLPLRDGPLRVAE